MKLILQGRACRPAAAGRGRGKQREIATHIPGPSVLYVSTLVLSDARAQTEVAHPRGQPEKTDERELIPTSILTHPATSPSGRQPASKSKPNGANRRINELYRVSNA